jgi:hypothetical protein
LVSEVKHLGLGAKASKRLVCCIYFLFLLLTTRRRAKAVSLGLVFALLCFALLCFALLGFGSGCGVWLWLSLLDLKFSFFLSLILKFGILQFLSFSSLGVLKFGFGFSST